MKLLSPFLLTLLLASVSTQVPILQYDEENDNKNSNQDLTESVESELEQQLQQLKVQSYLQENVHLFVKSQNDDDIDLLDLTTDPNTQIITIERRDARGGSRGGSSGSSGSSSSGSSRGSSSGSSGSSGGGLKFRIKWF
ncbi:unnamed protein product [Ambrosiozyma monospora]|uniref:Unnamed protein product n=1 Tax=Ambrosiozyma monospora TaxID=43982 RepID=A0ACB5T844_AMBMO|nr:unnamed protein product [Ambrosiozyma monospora]